jgi:ferredoxin
MPNVTFVNWNKTVRVGALANVRRIAVGAGVPLYNGLSKGLNCHGSGVCGTCRVVIEPADAVTPPTFHEKLRGCTGPYRLACQALTASDRHDVRVTKMEGFYGKGRHPVDVEGMPPTPSPASVSPAK